MSQTISVKDKSGKCYFLTHTKLVVCVLACAHAIAHFKRTRLVATRVSTRHGTINLRLKSAQKLVQFICAFPKDSKSYGYKFVFIIFQKLLIAFDLGLTAGGWLCFGSDFQYSTI